MSSTTSHRPPPKPLDLEITIISAKHLKNVNWRNGDLTPYVIFYLDPNHRLATKSDDSNSTKPVWNERFLIPVPSSPSSILTLEIFHSKPSDTPKPLVGTLRLPITDLPNPHDPTVIRTFDLHRPSGRPSGKIRLKLALRERILPDYQITPQPTYYYTTAPGRYNNTAPVVPSLPPRPYQYGPSYSGYYQGGYYPQTPSPYTDRHSGYGDGGMGGPSAPADYVQFEEKAKTGNVVESGVGGLVIDEKIVGERVEGDLNARELDDYSSYRRRADY